MNTVTYGTASAPYLAMRCLKEIASKAAEKLATKQQEKTSITQVEDLNAEGGEKDLSSAIEVLERDFYMDDVLTGTNSLAEAIQLQKQLTELLVQGQFALRKWRSNDAKVLKHLNDECKTDNCLIINEEETQKTLGVLWNAKEDTLHYQFTVLDKERITKRGVLSKIAQVYDPLGLIGPVLINYKIFMQRLWEQKLDWDDPLPSSLEISWKRQFDSLHEINEVAVQRNINPDNETGLMDIYGFGDASEKACVCLYAISCNKQGKKTTRLICAKTRVAPLKVLSLPRLELCAALLLVELLKVIEEACKKSIARVYLWSDSTVVLEWIKMSSNQLKAFVANRVARIQELSSEAYWKHVPSEDNPADLLSRGITVEQLRKSKLWWEGPEWITSEQHWPQQPNVAMEEASERVTVAMSASIAPPEVLTKQSSYSKLRRVIAFCQRFIINLRGAKKDGPLSLEELEEAETAILQIIQRDAFAEEIKALPSKRAAASKQGK
ncbi:uncharacterized protein [Mycetomoellerius zeteki]|uniref:uncharacterized protein n=1 Tax=Mycetomoellerius zeteki TaxID=64791 RepID=UPI00084EAAEC|nr:PREDICTED: uncharacterized protein LOC108730217 [Trachymyrmex zeteki]